jgi:hypothetical protein
VVAFPTPGLEYQVTIGGGDGGFAPDGRRFLYLEAKTPGVLRVADIHAQPTFSLVSPAVVGQFPPDLTSGDLTHDGKRVLMFLPTEKAPPQTATMLQNWRSALRVP